MFRARARVMPLLMALELAVTLRRHWTRLQPDERVELARLLRKSQGRPGRLSSAERTTLRRLVMKLEPLKAARSVAPIGRRAARSRRGF